MSIEHAITSKRNKSFRVGMALAVLVFCIFVYRVIPLSYRGQVRDAETGRALKGVSVLLEVSTAGLLSHGFGQYGIGESMSDYKGTYRVRLKGLRPSPWYLVRSWFTYFKPGYFPRYYHKHSGNVGFYRMSHYLNYHALLDSKTSASSALWYSAFPAPWSHKFERLYKKFKEYAARIRPAGPVGEFYKCPGAKFEPVYARMTRAESHLDKMTYYVLDQNSKIWLVLDSRGEIVDRRDCSGVSWETMSSHKGTGLGDHGHGHLFADRNTIFLKGTMSFPSDPTTLRPGPINRSVVARKGNITAVTGVPNDFITIEDGGRFLCHYGNLGDAKSRYPELRPAQALSHGFCRAFRVGDLVSQSEEDIADGPIFTHVSYCSDRYFVVAKTANHWHVFRFFDRMCRREGKARIVSFPAKRKITAISAGAKSIYIAIA